MSDVFFRELESLIRLSHAGIVQIVGYFLATRNSPAQITAKYALNGFLASALDNRLAGYSAIFWTRLAFRSLFAG
jgi:hypothetical protein